MKRVLSGLVLLVSISIFADDLVVVKGGREIRGQITAETETHVDIFTDYGKQLHIHKTRIANLVRNGQAGTGSRLTASGQLHGNKDKALLLGLELGLASSGVSIEPAPTTSPSSKSGMLIGIVGEYPVTEMFFAQAEMMYSQLGYTASTTTELKYNVLKIPILAKVKYPVANEINLTGFLGPSLGFLMGASSVTGTTSTDVSANTKSMLFGLELGAGAEYKYSANINLFLNLRYGMQLNNLDATVGSTTTAKLKDFDVLAGILYRI